MNNDFSIAEALDYGWSKTRENLALLIGVVLFNFVVGIVASAPANLVGTSTLLGSILQFLAMLVNYGLMMGFLSVCLKIADEGEAGFADFFEPLSLFPQFAIAMLIFSISVGIGFIFLIIPGLFLLTMFFFTPFIVLDEQPGAIQALTRSNDLSQGIKLNILLLFIALAVINAIGALFCGVGLLITIPITYLAATYAYRTVNPKHSSGEPIAASL